MSDLIHVRPILYRLDIDDERHKKLRPYFKLSSGPYSRTSKRVDAIGRGTGDTLTVGKKAEDSMIVELWDRHEFKKENLLGKGTLDLKKFSGQKGITEEWVILYDNEGKQIGKALLEIEMPPEEQKLTNKDLFQGVMEDARNRFGGFIEDSISIFDRMLKDTSKLFEDISKEFGMDEEFPRLKGEESMKSRGTDHGKIDIEKPQTLKTQDKTKKTMPKKRSHHVARQARNRFESLIENQTSLFEKMIEDTRKMFDEFAKDMWEDEDFIFPSISREKKPEIHSEDESIRNKHKELEQTKQKSAPILTMNEKMDEEKPIKPSEPETKGTMSKIQPESVQVPWSNYEQEMKNKFNSLIEQQQKMFNSFLENSKMMLEGVKPQEKMSGTQKTGKNTEGGIFEEIRSGFDRMFNQMMEESKHMFEELMKDASPKKEDRSTMSTQNNMKGNVKGSTNVAGP